MKRQMIEFGCLSLLVVVAGCSSQTTSEQTAAPSEPTDEGRRYLLSEEPADAQDIIAAREQAADGDDVAVIGRIGGSHEPWIEGLAAFSIVDRSLAACSDIPGDQCPTPWDYCCVTDKLPDATALVKVVDSEGKIVDKDARELLGLSELQTVVVQGKAQRDETGNMTILASALYPHEGDLGQHPPASLEGHTHDHEHDQHDHVHDHAEGAEHDPDTSPTEEADGE